MGDNLNKTGNQRTVRSLASKVFKAISGVREATLIIIILAIGFVVSLLTPAFLTLQNLRITGIGLSTDGVVLTGMTIVLILGGFDLSVGSVIGLSGIITAAAYTSLGMNIWLAAIIAMISCALVGLINGVFISKIGLSPLIVTLATMSIGRGLCFVITQGAPIPVTNMTDAFHAIGTGKIGGIPIIIIIFLSVVLIGDILVRRSIAIRQVFYIGSNPKAAKLAGINIPKVTIIIYLLSAVFAGFAGIMQLSRFGVATPISGTGTELLVISAAVIGGASLSGGEGTILGAVLGLVLLSVISNALVLLNVSVYLQQLISGIILLVAVTIDQINYKVQLKSSLD